MLYSHLHNAPDMPSVVAPFKRLNPVWRRMECLSQFRWQWLITTTYDCLAKFGVSDALKIWRVCFFFQLLFSIFCRILEILSVERNRGNGLNASKDNLLTRHSVLHLPPEFETVSGGTQRCTLSSLYQIKRFVVFLNPHYLSGSNKWLTECFIS